MITGKINVSLIDKDKLFKGKKGLYLDFVMFETPDNQYGDDYMIKQSLTKEERDAGADTPILGNAKIQIKQTQATDEDKADLPF